MAKNIYCPNCKKASLKEILHKSIMIDVCTTCKGIWFDRNELETIFELAVDGLGVPKDAVVVDRDCPSCMTPMHQFKYPQTYCVIDMCDKCKGIWLDDQELQELRTVRGAKERRGALDKTAPPTGAKASIIDMINSTIDNLMDFGN